MCEIACVGLRPTQKKEVSGHGEGERGAKTTQTQRWEGRGCDTRSRWSYDTAQLKKYQKPMHHDERQGDGTEILAAKND